MWNSCGTDYLNIILSKKGYLPYCCLETKKCFPKDWLEFIVYHAFWKVTRLILWLLNHQLFDCFRLQLRHLIPAIGSQIFLFDWFFGFIHWYSETNHQFLFPSNHYQRFVDRIEVASQTSYKWVALLCSNLHLGNTSSNWDTKLVAFCRESHHQLSKFLLDHNTLSRDCL